MPVRDPAKNRDYVAKHRAKKREEMGTDTYKKERAEEMKVYRAELKAENKEEYLKNNAEYMREYRQKKKEASELDEFKSNLFDLKEIY